MSASAPEPRELTAEEMATALAWIDGELELEAATAFELRLSQDRELARRVEGLTGLDAWMRRNARGSSAFGRKRRRVVGLWVSLAAAALVTWFVLTQLFESTRPECDVALAPGFALAEDWVDQAPGLEGASAPGIAVSRGPNPRLLSAEDFLSASQQAETAVVDAALAAQRREIEAGWFVVPIELDEPAWVIVLSFPESGAPAMLFPRPEPAGSPRVESFVAGGRSLLPSDRAVQARTPGALEYRPGFLVPLGSKRLTVLVAARNMEGGAEQPWAEIERWLASGESADQVEARLSKLGFATQRLLVVEPR